MGATDNAPELATKNLDSLFLNDSAGAGAGQWDAEIKAILDNFTLKSLFFTEDWVFILLDLIASEISGLDMRVVNESFEGGRKVLTPVDNHPLNTLIRKPNPNQEYSTWMYLHVIEYLLMGNAIQWYAEGSNQLHILPAEQVFVDQDPRTGKLKRYIVNTSLNQTDQSHMTFRPDVIMHQRRPNPNSVFWGLSPFVPNSKSLLFNRYSQDYLNSFYLKQATGQMALTLDKQVSEEAALRLMRSFEHSYTGRKNQRRTMILPKGVSIEQISQTIADQNLIEIVNQNREKIINILRIPKHALSLAEAGSLGSEEHKTALKFMWTSAFLPVMKKVSEAFTKFFQDKGLLSEAESFHFDTSDVEILREDSVRLAELAVIQLNFKTLNEVRRDLYDLEPLEGGDVTPLPVHDPFGVPVHGEDGVEEPQEQEDEPEEEEDNSKAATLITMAFESALELNQKFCTTTLEKNWEEMQDLYLDYVKRTGHLAISKIKRFFKNEKIFTKSKTEITIASGSVKRFMGSFEPAMDTLTPEFAGKYAIAFSHVVKTSEVLTIKGLRNESVRHRVIEEKDLDHNIDMKMVARGRDVGEAVKESLTKLVLSKIEKALANGANLEAMIRIVIEALADRGKSQSSQFVENEFHTCRFMGKSLAMETAASVQPDLIKVWISKNDGKGRHQGLHGKMLRVKNARGEHTEFSNGLRYPRDIVTRNLSETMGCRCDLVLVTPQDLDQLSIPRPKE